MAFSFKIQISQPQTFEILLRGKGPIVLTIPSYFGGAGARFSKDPETFRTRREMLKSITIQPVE